MKRRSRRSRSLAHVSITARPHSQASKGKPPELVAGDDKGVKQVQGVISGGACHLKDFAFEDAVKPPGGLPPLLTLVGDAEIGDARDVEGARGALDLTPLRKGVGLVGAAWYHRPLSVRHGFETEFTFKILPPEPAAPDAERPRASDGFAFVLQLDQRDAFLDPPIDYDERPEEKPRVSKGIGAYAARQRQVVLRRAVLRGRAARAGDQRLQGQRRLGRQGQVPLRARVRPRLRPKDGALDPKASKAAYVATKHAGRECIYKWRREGEDKDRYAVAPQLPPGGAKKVDIEESHRATATRVGPVPGRAPARDQHERPRLLHGHRQDRAARRPRCERPRAPAHGAHHPRAQPLPLAAHPQDRGHRGRAPGGGGARAGHAVPPAARLRRRHAER